MTTARKKARPPGGVGSAEHKAAQESRNKAMSTTLHALAQSSAGPAVLAALEGTKRPRGRPATTGTTPAKARKASSRAAATQEGGKRLHVMLTPDGASHLRQIMEDNEVGQTEAVHIALKRGR